MRIVKILPVVFLIVVGAAQVQLPGTPAARQCAAWLKEFNHGDRNAYRTFLQQNFPSQLKDLERDLAFRDMTGGFELKKVEESTPSKIVVLVQERLSDQFARLTLEVQSNAPHQITSLDLRAIPRPPEFALPHLNDRELVAAAQKKLEQEAVAERFSGAVVLTKNGKPMLAETYGFADREHKIPNTLKTRFRIGSMNKMFTAVAVLQLAEAGKLDINDPFGKYVPDYPNKDVAGKVTVDQLLTHTGGTGDIFGPEFEAHRLELRTLDDYVKLYGNRPLKFAPGSRWGYSNYGYILLGVLIEKVSGRSYYDYVREHVYTPAGMISTGSEPEDQHVPDRSVGYTKLGTGAWHPNTDTLPYRGTSAGGGYSTVEDLQKFAAALQEHKLLDALYTAKLITGKINAMGGRYAYGFEDQLINGTHCYGHGGGAPGMNGELEICPNVGYVVAVLANIDPPAATRIASFITNRLPEQ